MAKIPKNSKKYERIAQQLENAKRLKSQNMWKLGKAGQGIDKVEDIEKLIKNLPYSTEIREKLAEKNFLRVIKAYNC